MTEPSDMVYAKLDFTVPTEEGDVFAPGAIEDLTRQATTMQANEHGAGQEAVFINGNYQIPDGLFGYVEGVDILSPGVFGYRIKPVSEEQNPDAERIMHLIQNNRQLGVAIGFIADEYDAVYSWHARLLRRAGLGRFLLRTPLAFLVEPEGIVYNRIRPIEMSVTSEADPEHGIYPLEIIDERD